MVAEMVCELDFDRPVVEQLSRAGTVDVVHFVEPGPGEEDHGAAVFEVEAGLHGAEDDLAVAIRSNGHHGRLDQIEVVTIPEIGLDDPPAANQLAVHWRRHGPVSSSLGNRTRL